MTRINESCVDRLEVESVTGNSSIVFALDPKYNIITASLSHTFPDDMGSITLSVDVDGDNDLDQLYRLVRRALERQIAEAEADLPEPLPSIQEIQDAAIPPLEILPLCIEHTGRKKVIDVRADEMRRRMREEDTEHKQRGGVVEWAYLPGVVVHRSECVKVRGHVKEVERKATYSLNSNSFGIKARDGSPLDGRFARWAEILPQIRKGALHVTMCMTCKPLGRYSRTVNTQLSFAHIDQPPPEFGWEFPGFYEGPVSSTRRRWVWRTMNAMTPTKWEALADLIAWAALEVDPEAFADDSDVMVSQ